MNIQQPITPEDFAAESERFHLGYVSALRLAISIGGQHGMTLEKLQDALQDVLRIHTEDR